MGGTALEEQTDTNLREQHWQEVEFTMIYRAVFVRYMQQGLPDKAARQRAFSEVKGYLGRNNLSGVRVLSAGNGQTGQEPNGQSGRVKQEVRAFLDTNPGLDQQSINQIRAVLKSAGVKGGRTTIAEVLQERKRQIPT